MNKKFVSQLIAVLGLLSLVAWTSPMENMDFVNSHLDEQEEIISPNMLPDFDISAIQGPYG